MSRDYFAVLAVILCFQPLSAQQVPLGSEGTGTVVGHVVCGDTGKPARFAQAILMAVPKVITKPIDPTLAAKDPAAALAKGLSAMGDVNMVESQTGFDGGYTAINVAPGDYYLFASVPGYIQPTNLIQSLQKDSADYSKPLPGVPVVHVSADRTINADISASRGAAISGTVAWDDGSPITRATVQVLPASSTEQQIPPQFGMLTMFSMMGGGLGLISDDQGHFRISGLAPGTYILKVSFQGGAQVGMGASSSSLASLGSVSPLVVYAPSAPHRTSARPFTLQAGEDARDINVTFNLSGTHSVSGRVEALSDHHGVNAGRVILEDKADKTLIRSAGVDAQGNYTINFVPAGTYTLSVSGAEDTKPSAKKGKGIFGNQPETVRSYADSTPVDVAVLDSNITGENVELTPEDPAAAKKKEAEIDKLFNQ